MNIPSFSSLCLSEYQKQEEEGRLGKPQPPRFCLKEDCGKEDCYWCNGSYSRTVLEADQHIEISVPRFKCKFCGKTCSILPCFVVPYCQYTMKVIAEGVEGYAVEPKETSYRNEAGKLGGTGPSPTQLFRWVALFVKRIESLLVDTQALCISASAEDSELGMAETAGCPRWWKAVIPGKGQRLNLLAKLISFAGVLFKDADERVMAKLGKHFLQNVERVQQIFAHEGLWLQTPQRLKP